MVYCRYAMETHGVQAARLATPLTAETLQQGGKAASVFTARFLNVLPFIALGLAYIATQYAAYLKARPELHQALHNFRRSPGSLLIQTAILAAILNILADLF